MAENYKGVDIRKHDSLEDEYIGAINITIYYFLYPFLKTLYFHLLENCCSIFILLEQDTWLFPKIIVINM